MVFIRLNLTPEVAQVDSVTVTVVITGYRQSAEAILRSSSQGVF